MIWLPATLLAALFQAWRTAVQQRVRAELSVNAAGLVRYLYGFPVALLLLTAYLAARGVDVPTGAPAFWGFGAAAGLVQIIGTNLLIMAFGFRNYVVGTAYAKTEAVQGAILAMILLGEHLSALTWIGIALGVVGVMILSAGSGQMKLSQLAQPAALCGLGAGLMFALTSVFVKRAAQMLPTDDMVLAALTVLVVVMGMQTLMQGSYVMLREGEQLPKIAKSWRVSGQVGVLAALGSACWFTGFAIAPVALVRAVGQVEVVFTLGFGRFYLGEPLAQRELTGLLIVASGVVLALLGSLVSI
jgi:drug/metabolite transporter (DMT)-like permease